MASPKEFLPLNPDGMRFAFAGISTSAALDDLPPNKYAFAQNVRVLQQGQLTSRAPLSAAVLQLPAGAGLPVRTVRRLNDTSGAPNVPAGNFAYISAGNGLLFCGVNAVSGGLSGNPVSLVPFRPDTSVQPWMYVADADYMGKVRSDGTTYHMGIKEPQAAPVVGTQASSRTGSFTLLGTAVPWSNVGGQNASYNYGDNGTGTGPGVISTPNYGATVTLTITGLVTVSGAVYGPNGITSSASNYPAHFLSQIPTGSFAPANPAPVLVGAFTDGDGNVISSVVTSDVDVVGLSASVSLKVPTNAVQLQLGINAAGGTFAANSGSFSVSYSVSTASVSTVAAISGSVTAYYWGDSPHSGSVGYYIWQSENDTRGSGTPRGISSAAGSTIGSSLLFDVVPTTTTSPAPAVAWTVFDDTGTSTGTVPLFEPALETEGYQDFNVCIVCSIFIPAAGTYSFTVTAKDNILWGFGNNASWAGAGTIRGFVGQSMTVVSGLPLMPAPTETPEGAADTITVPVTFPGAGIYPFEVDWDYWDKTGRTLTVTCNSTNLAPLVSNVKNQVQYRYTFRSSATGAVSNPSPESIAESIPVLASTLLASWSSDPQVDKIDFYRMDTSLDNFTYVATAPNTNPPTLITDSLLDVDVSDNPILQFDNYEPFPSLDLPRKGIVNVTGGAVLWVSGDQFNVRWLPGSIINIAGIAYTLDKRPTSPVMLTAGDIPSAYDVIYEIDAATLAAQPLGAMWGPTSEGNFMMGCRDPLRPGTFYWTKGNAPDAAPDTNQQDLTSPSEPLQNGCIANGISVIFSSERAWLITPTFTSALATVSGDVGSTWNPVLSPMTRGLYMPWCLTVSGGGDIFFRAKDSICVSAGGGAEKSITDDIWNLFPHEGHIPVPIVVQGYVIHPPDDTQPNEQQLSFATGYLYYDYMDTTGNRNTLVFDTMVGGWVIDVYGTPVVVHMLEEGPTVNGVMVGCTDGSVRLLTASGSEAATCVVLTRCEDAGQTRAPKRVGDLYLQATIANGTTLGFLAYSSLFTQPVFLNEVPAATGNGSSTGYIWNMAQETFVDNLGVALTWSVGTSTIIQLWQPNWIVLPEQIQARITDWNDCGQPGAKLIEGILLEANTYGQLKTLAFQSADDNSYHYPVEGPAIAFNNQAIQAYSFQPFVSHSLRIVPKDYVPWQFWSVQYDFQPYSELVDLNLKDYTDAGQPGAKFVQGFRLEADTQGIAKNFALQSGDDLSIHVANESPGTYFGRAMQAFSVQPFISHELRIVSSDLIPWRLFGIQYVYEPYPELVDQYQSEFVAYGPGWQSIREMNIAYISTAFVTVTLTFDQWPAIVLPALPPSPSQLYPIKTKVTVPVNKSKLMALGITSTSPFRLFKNLLEVKSGIWGRDGAYEVVQPLGGDSAPGAEL